MVNERRAEEKFLTRIYAREVFEGSLVRQEVPRCCGEVVDLYANSMHFKEIRFGSKTVNLLEPRCPSCGRHVEATFSLLN